MLYRTAVLMDANEFIVVGVGFLVGNDVGVYLD